jgi:hypothetical protein
MSRACETYSHVDEAEETLLRRGDIIIAEHGVSPISPGSTEKHHTPIYSPCDRVLEQKHMRLKIKPCKLFSCNRHPYGLSPHF